MIKTRQNSCQEYTKFKLRLDSKKEKLFLSNDPSKWELSTTKIPPEILHNKPEALKLMCFKENLIEKELKNLYGYYNSQVLSEISKGFDLKAYGYRKILDSFTKETQIIYEEMIKDWYGNLEFCGQELKDRPSLFRGSSIMEKIERKTLIKENFEGKNYEKSDKRIDSDSD